MHIPAEPTEGPPVEIDWRNGKPGATSVFSGMNAGRAFVHQTKGTWPWANKEDDPFPVLVWNRLPALVTVVKLSYFLLSFCYGHCVE